MRAETSVPRVVDESVWAMHAWRRKAADGLACGNNDGMPALLTRDLG
jgi:hypothetical protein